MGFGNFYEHLDIDDIELNNPLTNEKKNKIFIDFIEQY